MSDELRERVEALKSRVATFHGTHNQSSHGHRYGPGGELKSRVGKAADKVSKAKSEVNGGSAKDRMKGAGPDGWKARKDGGFTKHNPGSGSDHLIKPTDDGKWSHSYQGKGESSVNTRRFSSKEAAMADAERVIKQDAGSASDSNEQDKLDRLSDREVALLDGLHSGNGKAMLKDDAKLKEWAGKWDVSEQRARELAQHLIDRDEAHHKDKMSAHDKKVADTLAANKGKAPRRGQRVVVDMNGTRRIVKVDQVKNGKVVGPTVDGLDELYFEDPTDVVKG